jgi:hypothetical protein
MGFRPEFREALSVLATAVERLTAKGYAPPVLVGGGAVVLYTGGEITSGDFDFVSGQQVSFFEELKELGFLRPSEPGCCSARCGILNCWSRCRSFPGRSWMGGASVKTCKIRLLDLPVCGQTGQGLSRRPYPDRDRKQCLAGNTIQLGDRVHTMTLNDLEARIERRKAELGFVGGSYVMPNSGEARAPEKRELLRILAAEAEERRDSLPFKANY